MTLSRPDSNYLVCILQGCLLRRLVVLTTELVYTETIGGSIVSLDRLAEDHVYQRLCD